MGRFVRVALRGAQAHVQQVTPVPRAAARGTVAAVYDQLERDFGMLAPPILLHSPAPEAMAASWATLRETLVASGWVSREAKEAVAAAVSIGNSCPYCVDVHGATLHGLVRGADAAAVHADRLADIADPTVRAAAAWARFGATRSGAEWEPLPGPAGHAPELIGTAVTFHYLNRMVSVFLTASPLPPAVPAAARATVLRVLGRLLRPAARAAVPPGDSVDLLPVAPLPADLGWALGNAAISGAFARAAAATEAAGERSVPAPVRTLVRAELARWDGRPAPLVGTAWLDRPLRTLDAADRPAGRLALLTALAAYRVDQAAIDGFRATGADDRALVELTAWASMAAARQAGCWLWTGATRTRNRRRAA